MSWRKKIMPFNFVIIKAVIELILEMYPLVPCKLTNKKTDERYSEVNT